jgi:hypothetical protein
VKEELMEFQNVVAEKFKITSVDNVSEYLGIKLIIFQMEIAS